MPRRPSFRFYAKNVFLTYPQCPCPKELVTPIGNSRGGGGELSSKNFSRNINNLKTKHTNISTQREREGMTPGIYSGSASNQAYVHSLKLHLSFLHYLLRLVCRCQHKPLTTTSKFVEPLSLLDMKEIYQPLSNYQGVLQ